MTSTEIARVRDAMAKLADVMSDLGRLVDGKRTERCPYRTARCTCTFGSVCQNQRRHVHTGAIVCAGDAGLRWNARA